MNINLQIYKFTRAYMMNRRNFLKAITVLGTSATIELHKLDIIKALAQAEKGEVKVLWLQGAGDTGCTISLLQGVSPDLIDAITRFRLAIDFHSTIMIPAADAAMKSLEDARTGATPLDVLIVEGSVPKGNYCTVGERGGKPVPFEDWVLELGKRATYVIAVGACAAYGGIPAGEPNPTQCRPVSKVLPGRVVINIPGCPSHPDWMLLTISAAVMKYTIPLDDEGRPTLFFNDYIHDRCPRRSYYDNLQFAETLSEDKCLWNLGCRGPLTKADCPNRLWNSGLNWCVGANAPCIGCTAKDFPDPLTSPFYEAIGPVGVPIETIREKARQEALKGTEMAAAAIAAMAAGAGIAAYTLRGIRKEKRSTK